MSEEIKSRKRNIVRNIFSRAHRPTQIPVLSSRPITPSSAHANPPNTSSPLGLRSRPSLAGQFSEAVLSSLTPDEHNILRKHLADNAGNIDDAIQNAYRAALVQKRECESRRWRLNFRGHQVTLRDEADKLVRWIERFKSVGDVVANVDPVHIGLPWAGIRMILEIATTDSHQTAALLAGMNLAMYMTNRLQAYCTFRAHLPDSPTTATFERALVKMYVIILQFLGGAIEKYQQGSATRSWRALWAESDLDGFESTCQAWANQVDIDANNCDRELSQQETTDTRRWRELTLEPALDGIASAVSDVLTGQQATEYRSIIDWLSPPDPYYNHDAACKKRTPNTGGWILQSSEYQQWRTSENTLLWLTGRVGCGKTVLCSTIIEDIRSQVQNIPDTRFAFFYFSFSDKQKQSYKSLLTSLVAQLSRGKALFQMMQQLYDRTHPGKPSTEILEDTLSTCLQQRGQTVLVLDALDELPEAGDIDNNDGRPALMEWLGRLSQSSYRLRIIVTSRQLADIENSVISLGARCIILQPNLADDDIRKYIDTELEKDSKLRTFDTDTKEKIKAVLQQKSDGMFRWIVCQLDELKRLKLTRPRYIEDALYRLPRTLDATYERILLQIDDMFYEDALKALRWLAFQLRPLTVGELAEACLIDFASEYLVDVDGRGRAEEIVELLAGLVIVEHPEDDKFASEDDTGSQVEEQPSRHSLHTPHNLATEVEPRRLRSARVKSVVRLAHFSVKEYLTSGRITDDSSKTAKFALRQDRDPQILAQSCLAYVLHYSRSPLKTSSKLDLTTFPFLRYAAETWPTFISKHEVFHPAYELVLLQSWEHKKDWLTVYQPDRRWVQPFVVQDLEIGSALYYTSLIGLVAASQTLIDQGADVLAQGAYFNNALEAALVYGHCEVVRLLLNAGADAHEDGSALYIASEEEHTEVVRLLLDAGAEIDAQGGFRGSALQVASFKGHSEMVKLLLNAGADINASGAHDSALCAALGQGHHEVAMLLMDCGATIEPNALYIAAAGGNHDMVKSLIDRGADFNTRETRNALYAASEEGHHEVVMLLLDAGASVTSQDDDNALYVAAYEGHHEVAKLLLEAGADANARVDGHSVLHVAAAGGHREIAKLLLDAGADANAAGPEGSALYSASKAGYQDVVKLLLDAGADINVGGLNLNALYAASERGHKEVLRLMLNNGADVNVQGQDSALCIASAAGHQEAVQLLLHAGADVNAQGENGSALHVAAQNGHENIVRQLLSHQGDATCLDRHGWTPRMVASAHGHIVISDLLSAGGESPSDTMIIDVSEIEPTDLVSTIGPSTSLINRDGLAIKVSSESLIFFELDQVCQCRSDHPMPISRNSFYFEMTIIDCSIDSTFGLGVCEQNSESDVMPGWCQRSWGYHADDGKFFDQDGKGRIYGPTYTTGDIVGCGGDYSSKSLFFTKNGQHLGQATDNIHGRLFAVIGLGSNDVKVSVNFGSVPFYYQSL